VTRPTRPAPQRRRRIAAALTAVALLAPAAGARAQTEPTTTARAAAAWSASQLVDGERVFNEEFSFDDAGLTADVLLALAASGTGADTIVAIADWLATQVDAYTGATDGAVYVGPVAKLVIVAVATGRDASDVGGTDLVALLLAQESEDGRFRDASDFGDFSSTITQSLAVIALARAGQGPSATSVAYLAAQACADGGFPASLETAPCVSDVDSTGFAVDALVATGGDLATVGAAINWLEDVQQEDGSFAGSDGAPNANSTALAALALRIGGATLAADRAVDALIALAEDCEGDEPGSVRPRSDAEGDALRATTQAVLGLTGVGYASVDASGATAGLAPLDCDGGAAAAPAAPTRDADAAAADAATADTTRRVAALALALVAAVLVAAGLQRRRRARGTP